MKKEVIIAAEDTTTTNGLLVCPEYRKQKVDTGVILVPDPTNSQGRLMYVHQAEALARRGICALTIALPGIGHHKPNTRGEDIKFISAAYDLLTDRLHRPDLNRVGVFATGHCGYLAVLLTQVKPIMYLALCDPELYSDEDLKNPAIKLSAQDPLAYRKHSLHPGLTLDTREPEEPTPSPLSIECIQQFKGDLLMVELIRRNQPPKTAILDYMRYARSVRSWGHQTIDAGTRTNTQNRRLTRILTPWFVDKIKEDAGDSIGLH